MPRGWGGGIGGGPEALPPSTLVGQDLSYTEEPGRRWLQPVQRRQGWQGRRSARRTKLVRSSTGGGAPGRDRLRSRSTLVVASIPLLYAAWRTDRRGACAAHGRPPLDAPAPRSAMPLRPTPGRTGCAALHPRFRASPRSPTSALVGANPARGDRRAWRVEHWPGGSDFDNHLSSRGRSAAPASRSTSRPSRGKLTPSCSVPAGPRSSFRSEDCTGRSAHPPEILVAGIGGQNDSGHDHEKTQRLHHGDDPDRVPAHVLRSGRAGSARGISPTIEAKGTDDRSSAWNLPAQGRHSGDRDRQTRAERRLHGMERGRERGGRRRGGHGGREQDADRRLRDSELARRAPVHHLNPILPGDHPDMNIYIEGTISTSPAPASTSHPTSRSCTRGTSSAGSACRASSIRRGPAWRPRPRRGAGRGAASSSRSPPATGSTSPSTSTSTSRRPKPGRALGRARPRGACGPLHAARRGPGARIVRPRDRL